MSATQKFSHSYFSWLRDQAFHRKTQQLVYEGVLMTLYDIPFYWINLRDQDRAGDATVFRKYARHQLDQTQHDVPAEWLDRWEQSAPSVLEVMIGIAERWHQYFELPISFFFGHMFHNLRLQFFRGANLRPSEEEQVRTIIDNWLSRQIGPFGEGSPFPISQGFGPDMRTLDIWAQMNAYSFEHFQ